MLRSSQNSDDEAGQRLFHLTVSVRKTEERDIEAVLAIYADASAWFREQGIPQWQNGYPNRESLRVDMEKGASYVLEHDGKVIGTACILAERDPNYTYIENGQWLDDCDYIVIHRIAVLRSCKGRGEAASLIEEAEKTAKEKGYRALRADTHDLNLSMQRFLAKHGFVPCGRVYVSGGAPRIGFQKQLF